MKRQELEHLLRAVGSITGAKEVYVFGSQAILAYDISYDETIHRSMEADLAIPGDKGALSNEIEGSLGEGSIFAVTYGYYAEGVEEGVSCLPPEWKKRARRIYSEDTRGVTGVCPDVYDLCASKAIAGRDKDWKFIKALNDVAQLSLSEIVERIREVDSVSDDVRLRSEKLLFSKLGIKR